MSAKLVTGQGDKLKSVFESIRDFIGECRLIFREENVEFIGSDSANVVVFRCLIPAKNVRAVGGSYEFHSKKPIDVDVKTKEIATRLRCSSPRDIITFEIDPALPNCLVFIVQNLESSKYSRAEITLPMPMEDKIDADGVDSLEWFGSITMSSALFHDMIRDIASTDPNPPIVELYCDGYLLRLTAKGVISKVSFTIADKSQQQQQQTPAITPALVTSHAVKDDSSSSASDSDNDSDSGSESEENTTPEAMPGVHFERSKAHEHWPVKETYPIVFLQRVAKAKNVCSKITVHVRPGYPVAFEYDSQIGVLTYIISPRDADDIGDPSQLSTGVVKRPPPAMSSRDLAKIQPLNKRGRRTRPMEVEEGDDGGTAE